jgi:hypothetical protein
MTPLRESPHSDDFTSESDEDEDMQEAREQEERRDEEEEEEKNEEESETEEEKEREKRGKNEEEKKKENHRQEFSDISEEEIEHGIESKTLYRHFFSTFHMLQNAALREVGDVAGDLTISFRGATEFVSS